MAYQQLGTPQALLDQRRKLDEEEAMKAQSAYPDALPTDGPSSGMHRMVTAAATEAGGEYGEPMPDDQQMTTEQGGPDKEVVRKLKKWSDPINCKNIAKDLTDEKLGLIGQEVLRGYQIDVTSRSKWMTDNEEWMKLAMQVSEEKTTPWQNASNVIYPLMTTAAIQFNARAYPAIVQGKNVVKGSIDGADEGIPRDPEELQQMQEKAQQAMAQVPPEQQQQAAAQIQQQLEQAQWKVPPGAKRQRAQRIGDHMSWQLLKEQTEWEEGTDKMLLILPIVGCAFRKTFFAPELGRNRSVLVDAKKLVVNYWAQSLETAPRVTEEVDFYPNNIEELKRDEQWLDKDYKALAGGNDDLQKPLEFLEQHCLWDLDEDGYEEPYIVTVMKQGGTVARIVAAYEADGIIFSRVNHKVARIRKEEYYTKYEFLPNPDGGFYGIGFGRLLSPINHAVNTLINQMIDAGTLQNTGGGFIGRGFSTQSGSMRFKLGEWKYVNAPGGAIRDAIVPMQFAGPSPVLFQLLGTLVEAGKDIAAVKDVLTGGDAMSAQMQPTTLLALIEQGLKVFTAIFKRVHRAAQREFEKIYRLNQLYLEEQNSYQVGEEWRTITQEDYIRGAGVSPVSDPSMVSDMQRMALAQFYQGYQQDPLIDQVEIRTRIFEAAKVPNVDRLFAKQQPPNPELVEKTARLELDNKRSEVQNLKDITQAILNMAKADAEEGDQNLQWAGHQLEVIKRVIEGYTGVGPQGPQGEEQAQLPPPGDEMSPEEGTPGEEGAPGEEEEPPTEGARKAPDGRWYIADPNRQGKYMRVEEGGGAPPEEQMQAAE